LKKEIKDEGLFVKKKVTYREISITLYDFLEQIKIIIPFLNRLTRPYRLYYPWDSAECSGLAVKCLLKIYGMAALVVLLIFGTNPSLFSCVVSAYLIYIFSSEILYSSRIKTEIKFLKAFENFLNLLRHNYYKSGSVRNALADAENDAEPIIKGHIKEMLKVLSAPDPYQAVNRYVNSGYHKYLKLFITLARLVEENGDESENGNSVFLESCMRIKMDAGEDLRLLSERLHRFSGLVLTATLPAVAVPYIAMWGVSTIPSLNQFYYGYVGAGIKLLLIIVSLICYRAILRLKLGSYMEKNRLRYTEKITKVHLGERIAGFFTGLFPGKSHKYEERIKRLCERYTVKSFWVHKAVFFMFFFCVTMVTLCIGHAESRKIYKSDISTLEESIPVTDTRQMTAIKRLVPEITAFYCETGSYNVDGIKELLLTDRDIRTESVALKAAEEIVTRIDKYRKETFGISDIIICFIFAFIGFAIPGAALSFRKALIESRMQDEVMQFQSIIHMLKSIPGITVVSLLEEMELFSEVFKPAIRQCINEYNISDEKALRTLYEAEKYRPFRRVVDCFLMADELGLEDAFEEITAEIENFTENRKLERKINLDNEGLLGAMISVLPGGAILFGYLLCPFMIRSMQIFNEYQAGISMMG
jgi:hypothetical protein